MQLADAPKVLINAQDGTTKALRQWRMNSANEIKPAAIRAYVKQAIQLVRDGRSVSSQKGKAIVSPPEPKKALAGDAAANKGFAMLAPGLLREYTEYIASAKRDQTRSGRIEKRLPMIAAGVGLNDKYR